MAAKSLLLPKPRGKKKHPKTSWSSLLSFRTMWSFSPFQNRVVLFPISELRGPLHLLQSLVVLFLSPQNLVVLSYSLQNRVAPYLLQSRMVSSFLPQNLVVLPLLWLPRLGLNPSTHLPLQPISDSSYSQLHLPASLYSSSFTGLP